MERKVCNLIILGLILVNFISPVFSAAGDGGQPGYFLTFGTSVRALGLGRAFSAMGEDSSSILWNPASMSMLNQKEISTMYAMLFEGASYTSLCYAHPMIAIKQFNWGLAFNNMMSPKIQGYDAGGNILSGDIVDINTALTFGASFTIFTRGPQTTLPLLAVGANGKLIMKSFDDINTSGFGADLSVFSMPFRWLRLGYSLTNFVAPQLASKHRSEPEIIPAGHRIGLVLEPARWLILSTDFEQVGKSAMKPHIGLELYILGLALRAGYESAGYSAGLGLGFFGIILDYAMLSNTDLGMSHRMGLALRFGKDKESYVIHGEVIDILSRGRSLLLEGKLDKSVEAFNHVFKKSPDDPKAKKYLEVIEKIREDTANPVIETPDKAFINTPKGNIEVVAKDDIALRSLEVNGKATLATDLTTMLKTSVPITLSDTKPTMILNVKTTDIKGGSVTKKIEIGLDKAPPKILVEVPEQKEVTTSNENIKIVFMVEDNSGIIKQIKIGDDVLPEVKEIVEKEVSLKVGVNKIDIEVMDIAGNKAKEKLTVTREFVKIKMALLGLAGKAGVSAEEAEMISESIRVGIIGTKQFKLLERAEMTKVLQNEKFEMAMGCSDEKCAIRAGQLLKVQKMGFGYVHKMGNLYIITLRMVDVSLGEINSYVTDKTANKEELLNLAETVGRALVDKYMSGNK